jgi:hypothetical protein
MTYATLLRDYLACDEFNSSALNRQMVHDRPDWQQVGWDVTGRQCVSFSRSYDIFLPFFRRRSYLMNSVQRKKAKICPYDALDAGSFRDCLVRNEIIAPHPALTRSGAEFYPSCTQIRIGASLFATANQTVHFLHSLSLPTVITTRHLRFKDIYIRRAAHIFPCPPMPNEPRFAHELRHDLAGRRRRARSQGPQGGGRRCPLRKTSELSLRMVMVRSRCCSQCC